MAPPPRPLARSPKGAPSPLVPLASSPHTQALAQYNLREFDEAQRGFEQLLRQDPYRLEQADTYSNILYVKEAKRALSSLAHRCISIDKYRPEACCVIGNYYSLKGAHEKVRAQRVHAADLAPSSTPSAHALCVAPRHEWHRAHGVSRRLTASHGVSRTASSAYCACLCWPPLLASVSRNVC